MTVHHLPSIRFTGLNYKDVSDPACVVSFPLVTDPSVALLAWTTTPWTLPSNLGDFSEYYFTLNFSLSQFMIMLTLCGLLDLYYTVYSLLLLIRYWDFSDFVDYLRKTSNGLIEVHPDPFTRSSQFILILLLKMFTLSYSAVRQQRIHVHQNRGQDSTEQSVHPAREATQSALP